MCIIKKLFFAEQLNRLFNPFLSLQIKFLPIFSSTPFMYHSNLKLASPTGTTLHSYLAVWPSHNSVGPVNNCVKMGLSNTFSGSSVRLGPLSASSWAILRCASGCWVSNWILALPKYEKSRIEINIDLVKNILVNVELNTDFWSSSKQL